MHALLGQSGSGKTTLLNILSGKGAGVVHGTLLLNGRAVNHAELKHHASLVPQDDIMYDALSVRETLLFYSQLRLPPATAAVTRKRVDALMERLGLAYCADVPIGNALHPGISGGQRKRLSIGMELIDNPSLLFLDEPTSGLDSHNQDSVIAFLRDLADRGCTVVTTIHSPSMAIYSQFDSVLLLVRNVGLGAGSVAFQGTVGEEVAYFATLGTPLPPFANAAEHCVHSLDADHGALRLPTLWRLRRLQILYQTVQGLEGAEARCIAQRLASLLCIVDYSEDKEAAVPADMSALAEAIAVSGGSYLAFTRAMLACSIAANQGERGAPEAMHALGLPCAAPAPAAVERLSQVAQRMTDGPWFSALYADFAAAIAWRMGVCGPATTSLRRAASAMALDAPAGLTAAVDQAAQMERAYKAGGWSWELPAADTVQLLRRLGYARAMQLEPAQLEAFVGAVAGDDHRVIFGELATAIILHARVSVEDTREAARTLLGDGQILDRMRLQASFFPGGQQRLDGAALTAAQWDSYERFLDADGDGSVSAEDVQAALRACTGLRGVLDAAAEVAAEQVPDVQGVKAFPNSKLMQFQLLLRREFRMYFSDSTQLATAIGSIIVIPLFLGGMYWRIDQTQQNYANLVAALFLTVLFSGMLPLNTTMLAFPSEQTIVQREFANASYHALPYYLSKILFLTTTRGGISLAISTIVYFMSGIYPRPLTAGNVLLFMCTVAIVVLWSSTSGLMFGILVPDAAAAATVSMPFLLIQILFSGFYLTKDAIPPWFIWAYYISFFRYSLAVLVRNLFHSLRFEPCKLGAFCPFGPQGSGRDVERQYGVDGISTIGYIAVCVSYAVLMAAIGYAALLFRFSVQMRRRPSHPQTPSFRTLGVRLREIGHGGEEHAAAPPPKRAAWAGRAMRALRRRRGSTRLL